MHIVKRELGEAAAGHYEVKCKRGGNTEAEPIHSRAYIAVPHRRLTEMIDTNGLTTALTSIFVLHTSVLLLARMQFTLS